MEALHCLHPGLFTDHHPRILQLLDLYCALCSWTLSWAAAQLRHEEVQGFILCLDELSAMGIHPGELLSLLIANPPDEPLVGAVSHYEYQTFQETIRSARPGEPVEGTRVWRLRLKSHPAVLPFAILLNAFEQECKRLGVNGRVFLFSYHNSIFDQPMKLANSITHHEFDPFCIAHEFDYWRQGARGELLGILEARPNALHPEETTLAQMTDTARLSFLEEHLDELEPSDRRLADYGFSRKEIAQLLNETVEAVRGWDRRGLAPGGIPWVEYVMDGRIARYKAPEVLPVLQEIKRRNHNQEHARQLAAAILAHKYSI